MFLIKIAVEKTRLTSRTSEPMRKYRCDRKNGVYIAYEEQEDPMRIADEQDKMKKKENNTRQLGASTTRS